MTRKHFLRCLAISMLGAGCRSARHTAAQPRHQTPLEFGWTTCLTYETGERRLAFDYYDRLLDEMSTHRMTRLIVMMASHGYFDPKNHGLAWPVRNPRLASQVDPHAINADETTEFFSRVVAQAKGRKIKILIELKYLGMRGIEVGYPGVEFLRTREGNLIHTVRPEASDDQRRAITSLHICCDNPQAHQFMRDQIADVLNRYRELDGLVLEHPSYAGDMCYCSWSRRRARADTGREIEELSRQQFQEWKSRRIKETLLDLKQLVKSINPRFEFGFYTGFSPSDGNIAQFQHDRGHDTASLAEVGLDFVMPYCEGRHQARETEEIERVIDFLKPLDFYLHTTIRREPPLNYPLPPKGPEYIQRIIRWGRQYHRRNPRFKGMMFFNEVKLPQENRDAVYAAIKR